MVAPAVGPALCQACMSLANPLEARDAYPQDLAEPCWHLGDLNAYFVRLELRLLLTSVSPL